MSRAAASQTGRRSAQCGAFAGLRSDRGCAGIAARRSRAFPVSARRRRRPPCRRAQKQPAGLAPAGCPSSVAAGRAGASRAVDWNSRAAAASGPAKPHSTPSGRPTAGRNALIRSPILPRSRLRRRACAAAQWRCHAAREPAAPREPARPAAAPTPGLDSQIRRRRWHGLYALHRRLDRSRTRARRGALRLDRGIAQPPRKGRVIQSRRDCATMKNGRTAMRPFLCLVSNRAVTLSPAFASKSSAQPFMQ